MKKVELRVSNLPNPRLAFSNRVYVNKSTFAQLVGSVSADLAKVSSGGSLTTADPHLNVIFSDLVFMASPLDGVNDGEIALNSQQRKCGQFTLSQALNVIVFVPTTDVALHSLTIQVDLFVKKAGSKLAIQAPDISEAFKSQFQGQVFSVRQQIAMDFEGSKLDLLIEAFEHAAILDDNNKATESTLTKGQILPGSTIFWKKSSGSTANITFIGGEGPARNDSLFRSDFNFEQMGIGGLDEQFKKMFRTAFASRIFPGLVKQVIIEYIGLK